MQDTTLNSAQAPVKYNKPIIYFLLFWALFNGLQAYTLGVHADEAYYWLYSRFMDWGYYDHPPMVAVFIRAGYSLMHNEFGLRLFTVISSTASVYLMWLILKKYKVDAVNFILVISGIFVFHIYGFITTPDAPLLFFTVLFLYFYQQYIEQDSWQLALILSVVIACLLYSKYHGVLLIGFTVISNLKLLQRKTFYGIVLLAVALYIPHIVWQAHNGFPSINYHLSERSSEHYNFEYTYVYPLGQLAMAGPLIGWFLFYRGFSTKSKDAFMRTLLFNSIGILAFFFLTSFKGEVQLHWTLIAYVPLSMLVLISFTQPGGKPAWFNGVAIANIILIMVLRIAILIGPDFIRNSDALDIFYGRNNWAKQIKAKAGDNYVIFTEGFQSPSRYNFYNNTLKAFAYDSRYYRRTQYDIWPIEDSLQHKKVYYVIQNWIPGFTTDSIITPVGKWYGLWVNNVRTYQKIDFETASYKVTAAPGQKMAFDLTFKNPYPYAIDFSNKPGEHTLFFEACFFMNTQQVNVQNAGNDFYNITLKPGETTHYKFNLTAPKDKGKYELIFSLRTDPFVGGRNNRLINFTVE